MQRPKDVDMTTCERGRGETVGSAKGVEISH